MPDDKPPRYCCTLFLSAPLPDDYHTATYLPIDAPPPLPTRPPAAGALPSLTGLNSITEAGPEPGLGLGLGLGPGLGQGLGAPLVPLAGSSSTPSGISADAARASKARSIPELLPREDVQLELEWEKDIVVLPDAKVRCGGVKVWGGRDTFGRANHKASGATCCKYSRQLQHR